MCSWRSLCANYQEVEKMGGPAQALQEGGDSSSQPLVSRPPSCSVAKLCPTLCDSVGCSIPGVPVLHNLPEFAQTHVH